MLNDKNENREWEDRWRVKLQIDVINWNKIWKRVYEKIHNPRIQSSLWEMIHLNYWSGFRAGDHCKLCREIEQDTTHISNECRILKDIVREFNLEDIYDSKTKLTFGTDDQYNNFFLFHIKSVIFRSRFCETSSIEQCRATLIRKCKSNIKKDVQRRYSLAKLKGNIMEFKYTFILRHNSNRQNRDNMSNNRIQSNLAIGLDEGGDLIFSF